MKCRTWTWGLGIAACMALQGCIGFEAVDDGASAPITTTSSGGDLPRLPLFQPVALNDEPMDVPLPPKRPKPRIAKRAPAGLEPPPGPAPAVTLASLDSSFAPAPEPARPEPVALPNLIGLDENQLTAALGAPVGREERAPGKVWHYRVANCRVAVSLFPEVHTMKFRSLAYEVTSDESAADDNQSCLPQRGADGAPK